MTSRLLEILSTLMMTTFFLTPWQGLAPVAGRNTQPSSTGAGLPLGTTEIVSISSEGEQGNDQSWWPSISDDGGYVAFISRASNLVSGDTNGAHDIFVYDRQTGITQRVSVADDGSQGNSDSGAPSISADGRLVAFDSRATNLLPGDRPVLEQIYVHDRLIGRTELVSISNDGLEGNQQSLDPSISADGRFVAFTSGSNNLVHGDTNKYDDVFVRDMLTGTIERVSISSDGSQAYSNSWRASISSDGRYVAFTSDANNLVSGDTNGAMDVFIHDRQTGTTKRVSISSTGEQGNYESSNPSISANGRYVAFESYASNLVVGDTNDFCGGIFPYIPNCIDIFVHDWQTGNTELVSVASDGRQGNSNSKYSSISSDGRYVAFSSMASNLVNLDTNGDFDIFVHDRKTGVTSRVSVSSRGDPGNYGSWGPSITADGRYVAFHSHADNLVTGDINICDEAPCLDVFVHDREGIFFTSALFLPVVSGDW